MKDLTGKTIGRLTVIRHYGTDPKLGNQWVCACKCGIIVIRSTSKLQGKYHLNPSCGCARKDSIKKASEAALKVTTKFSHPWKLHLKIMFGNMMKRCYKPGANRYERYGGRGITICDAWKNNRTAFYEWAIRAGYKPGMSIERINRDGNYCPENCRFATQIEQANNTSRNRFLSWEGKSLTVSQWAKELSVRPQAVQHRVDRGWSVHRIFTQPFRPNASSSVPNPNN